MPEAPFPTENLLVSSGDAAHEQKAGRPKWDSGTLVPFPTCPA